MNPAEAVERTETVVYNIGLEEKLFGGA